MSTYVGSETLVIDDWLRVVLGTPTTPVAALSGVGVTGVHDHFAEPKKPYPYVVFQCQSTIDVGGNGPGRWMVNAVYIVKAVAEIDTFEPLKSIQQAIDTILDGVTEAVALNGDAIITGVRRLGEHRFIEYEDGSQARQLGGEYRIYAQAA